jgi:predicted nucleotidyltransferase
MDPERLVAARRHHAKRDRVRSRRHERARLDRLGRVRAAVERLAPEHPAVRTVYLFGSLGREGGFDESSDVDPS